MLDGKGLAAAIEGIVRNRVQDHEPGCVVGVYSGEEIVYAGAFGQADLSSGSALNPSNQFNIASISKQFTAFAVMLLVEDGVISLEDPVRQFVPELPAYADSIRLRHLIHHTAGLRDYVALWRLNGKAFSDIVGVDETLELVSLQNEANAPAGTDYSYNNTGYFLLSLVVERVSGMSLAEFSRVRIFMPLGMNSTCIVEHYPTVLPDLAVAYSRGEYGAFDIDLSRWEPTGDGQVHTNILELHRWYRNFRTPTIGHSAVTELTSPGRLDDGTLLPYGGGIEIGRLGTRGTLRHSGGWAGYRSEFVMLPERELGVAVLSNRSDLDPTSIADAIIRSVFNEVVPADSLMRAVTGLQEGLYRNVRFNEHIAIDRDEEGLLLNDGDETRPVYVLDERLVVLEDGIQHLSSKTDADGITLTVDSGDGWETYRRCAIWEPSDRTLSALAGRYRNRETNLEYEIKIEDGKLNAFGPFGPLSLTPRSPFAFSSDGRPAFFFEYTGEGKTLYLDIGQRVRRVRFDKEV